MAASQARCVHILCCRAITPTALTIPITPTMPTPRSKLQSTNPPHLTGLLRPHIKSARKLTVHNNLPTNNLFHSLTPTPTIWRKAELPQAQVCGNPIPSNPIQPTRTAAQHSKHSTLSRKKQCSLHHPLDLHTSPTQLNPIPKANSHAHQ